MGALPEGRARLQIIHQEIRRFERFAAMGRSGGDEYDAAARLDQTVAMDDRQAEKRPARQGLAGDALDLGQGHGAVMLDFERFKPPALVATQADETDQRADIGAAFAQRIGLRGGVEILALNANDRRGFHRQPPVIGGKKAISLAPAIFASCETWAWSIAARITFFFSKAYA